MTSLKYDILVKLDCANYIREKIFSLCLDYCETQQPVILLKIGSYLGIFSTILRSTLNYTLNYYVENRLEQRVNSLNVPIPDKTQYNKLRDVDFPWVEGRSAQSIKRWYPNKNSKRYKMLELIHNYDSIAFDFLEISQPYHPGNEWLWHLMKLSNTDKHKNIIENRVLKVLPLNPSPQFCDDRVLIQNEQGEVSVHDLPYYYSSTKLFASSKKTWSYFEFTIDQEDPLGKVNLSLINFINDTPDKVVKIVDEFLSLPEK